ncbi:MAG: hypothetical protein SFV19_07100 [Rhodospirillaceae bacterium]|nr:hypothetical protein [Rhodospirillaceae bacterium]
MRRVFAALLICSLAFGVAHAVLDQTLAAWRAVDHPLDALSWRALASQTFLATLFAVTVLIIIGRPVFLVLKTRHRWHHAVIGGFAIALVVDVGLSAWLVAAQSPEASLAAAVPGLLMNGLRSSLVGALAAYVYWRIARPDRMAALTPP